ncbi:MAG: GNAT family N-acetyltransferase [Gemmatimonadales bacterium]
MQHDPARNIFEEETPEGTAYVSYAMRPGNTFEITYTFVPPAARGGGRARRLVLQVRDWAKEQGYEVTATCHYAARVLADTSSTTR